MCIIFLCIEGMAFLEETAEAVQVLVYTFVFLGVFILSYVSMETSFGSLECG